MINIIKLTITALALYKNARSLQQNRKIMKENETTAESILDEIANCRTETDLFNVRAKINRYRALNAECPKTKTLQGAFVNRSKALAKFDN